MGGDIGTAIGVLLAVAAGIVTVGEAMKIFEHFAEKAIKPQHEIAEQVEAHEQRLENDHKRLTELEESNRLIMRGVMQLMSHEIDGNHTEQLKSARDDMEEFLINK